MRTGHSSRVWWLPVSGISCIWMSLSSATRSSSNRKTSKTSESICLNSQREDPRFSAGTTTKPGVMLSTAIYTSEVYTGSRMIIWSYGAAPRPTLIRWSKNASGDYSLSIIKYTKSLIQSCPRIPKSLILNCAPYALKPQSTLLLLCVAIYTAVSV
jgi:hypothetical protein